MRRNQFAIMVAAILVVATAILTIPVYAVPGGLSVSGYISGNQIYSPATGQIGMIAKVVVPVSASTQFSLGDGTGGGSTIWQSYPTSYFVGDYVYVDAATNITAGTAYLISAYAQSTLTFTTASADGNWAAGDRIRIVTPEELAAIREIGGGAPAGAVATGAVTTVACSTHVTGTITVPAFAGLSTTLFDVVGNTAGSGVTQGVPQYVLRVDQVDAADADTVLLGMWRPIYSISSAGVVFIRPNIVNDNGVADTVAVLDAGDVVSVVPYSYVNPNTRVRYEGTAYAGTATTASFLDLIGRENAIAVNAIIRCTNDANAATNDAKIGQVTGFAPTTGTVTFTPTWTTATAVLDRFLITYDGLTEGVFGTGAGQTDGSPRTPVPTKLAVNVGMIDGMMYDSNNLDSLLTWAKAHTITKTLASIATGGTAFTAASTGGNILLSEISIQKITGPETGSAVTSLWVKTDDTVPLQQQIFRYDGTVIQSILNDLAVNTRYVARLNHILSGGKIVSLYVSGTGAVVASYVVELTYIPLTGAAALTAAP